MGIVFDSLRHLSVGRAARHGNLAVVPVTAGQSEAPPSRYRLLAGALRAGACRVEAAGRHSTQLQLGNDSGQAVLVVSGEALAVAGRHWAANLSLLLGPFGEVALPACRIERAADAARRPSRICLGLLPARARAVQLDDVSNSLQAQGLRATNPARVRAEITPGPATGDRSVGLSELYASHHQTIAACGVACPLRPRQLGAIYSLNGCIEALELFDSAATLRHFGPQMLASHAVAAGQGATRVESVPDQRALAEFFVQICAAEESWHEALGEGEDLRIEADQWIGAGLCVEGRLVHLVVCRRPDQMRFADPRVVPFRWRARAAIAAARG